MVEEMTLTVYLLGIGQVTGLTTVGLQALQNFVDFKVVPKGTLYSTYTFGLNK
jgi:hypothetical protein